MVQIFNARASSVEGVGILRLRKPAGCARRLAALRMTELFILFFLCVVCCTSSEATTYYVSSSLGSDSNSGTSAAAAWKTLGKVNSATFLAGDSVLLRRGDVWNESLVAPSSGAAGNPITFDAYGTGAAPNLTGWYAVPSSGWQLVSGNAWKAQLPGTFATVNFCLFGSIWGQKVPASSANLTAQWDFYLANGYLYVYSVGSPANFYTGPIVPMALSNVPVINTNGQSWLTFQHLLVNWFDDFGVYVPAGSDHLVFANMEADSMIPQGAQPLGFYVNEPAQPTDIKFYNDEAHMNYDGFRVDGFTYNSSQFTGTGTPITMVNDKAYANRDGALVDNTGPSNGTGAVTYSSCHFYASSLAVAGSTDVEATTGLGPVAGIGNVPADTPPAVQAWQRYPARVSLTVDDEGMTQNADSYYATTVLPVADAAGVPVGAAITVGYSLAQTLVPTFQTWINQGRDLTSHSISHTYYTNTDALDIRYVGTGTAASLSISNQTLTISVTGANDTVSYSLAQGQPQGTIYGLEQALTATGHFTATENPVCQGPYGTGCSFYTKYALLSQDLADVSAVDVKSGIYAMQLDVTRLTTDEITLSRQWMTKNLTGLPATPVYVYPGGYETAAMQLTASTPYIGARGALKEDLGVKDTYASGFDAQNVTSFGVNPSWMGLPPASLNQKIEALVWKQMVWGVPWGIFWHLNELTQNDPVGGTEVTNLIQDFVNSGATIQKNTDLVSWLTSGTLAAGTPPTDGNFYYKSQARGAYSANGGLDFRPTASSPVVDAGVNLGAAYAIDLDGVNQNSKGTGWEIGAHAYVAYSNYGEANAPAGSHFAMGGRSGSGAPNYSAARTDLTAVTFPAVPPQAGPNTCVAGALYNCGNLTGAGTNFVDPNFGTHVARLTDATMGYAGHTYLSHNTTSSGSGDENLWNCNSTMITFDDDGSRTYPMDFSDPSGSGTAMHATQMYQSDPNWTANNGFFIITPSFWSHKCPAETNILYNLGNGQTGTAGAKGTLLGHFDFTNQTTAPSFALDFDFTSSANCLGAGFPVTWTANGGNTEDGNDFGFGFSNSGGQGGAGAVYVAVWRKGSGCRVLNLSTLTVTGDWGPTGAIVGSGCAGGKIHNVKLFKTGGANGAIIVDYAAGCGSPSQAVYIWFYNGLQYNALCTSECQGHWTEGLTNWVNNPGNVAPNYWELRNYTQPGTPTGITPNLPAGGIELGMDWHGGWNALNDASPVFGTTAVFGYPVTTAWANEVVGFYPNAGSNPMRFASTYTTGGNYADFSVANSIGSISQDGRYYMWSSDWQYTLGGNTGTGSAGTAACIAGGPKWASNTVYAAGAIVVPTSGNAGNYSFTTTATGTSGGTQPSAWNQTIGGTTADGGVTWTNAGVPNCRGDVFVVKLSP